MRHRKGILYRIIKGSARLPSHHPTITSKDGKSTHDKAELKLYMQDRIRDRREELENELT